MRQDRTSTIDYNACDAMMQLVDYMAMCSADIIVNIVIRLAHLDCLYTIKANLLLPHLLLRPLVVHVRSTSSRLTSRDRLRHIVTSSSSSSSSSRFIIIIIIDRHTQFAADSRFVKPINRIQQHHHGVGCSLPLLCAPAFLLSSRAVICRRPALHLRLPFSRRFAYDITRRSSMAL